MSEMTERLERMTKARATLEATLADIKKAGNRGFAELVQPIFAEFPGLRWFSWTQYTPYFNDGDPCVFGANTTYINAGYVEPGAGTAGSDGTASSIAGDATEEDGDDTDDEDLEEIGTHASTLRYVNQNPWAERIGEVLGALGDEGLLALFGDHVRVRAERAGDTVTVSVEEYSHD